MRRPTMRAEVLGSRTRYLLWATVVTSYAFGPSIVAREPGGVEQPIAPYGTESITKIWVGQPQGTQDCNGGADCRRRAVEIVQASFREQKLNIQVSITGDNNEIIVFDSVEVFGQQQTRAAAKD